MNNTTAVDDQVIKGGISPILRILLAVITGVPILVNIFYVIICFKTLKKKFHNLLVLMLCVGDSILSFSLTWFSVVKLSDWASTNVHLCLFQTFAVSYGLMFTYLIVFLICYERYLVVKNYNFGVHTFFERFKVVIIGGTLALGCLYTAEIVIFVPHTTKITACTVPELYGDDFPLFIEFMVGGYTTLMCGIIIYCTRTSMLIWKLFFKPTRVGVHFQLRETTTDGLDSRVDGSMPCQCKDCKQQSNLVIDPGNSTLTEEEETKYRSDYKTESRTCSLRPESYEVAKKIRLLTVNWKKERIGDQLPLAQIKTSVMKKRKFKPDAWEKRAFLTSIIIAMSTLFLTGPFVVSFWLDHMYGARYTSQQARLLLFIPLMINSIINPFIYAWRIPEIKQEIRKIFRCGT